MVQNKHEYIRGRVLDIGSGGKPYNRLYYDKVSGKYGNGVTEWVGLDVRPVGEVQGDVTDIQLPDASFDTVLCVDTLSYVFDVHAAFLEIARVLKPGGTLLMLEPNNREDDDRAFWGFRLKGLGALAEAFGLEVIDLQSASRLWAGEYENMRGQTVHGFVLPPEFEGFMEAMDEKYPNVSVLVATKPLT
jgi:SAM-dependent methyltransferase